MRIILLSFALLTTACSDDIAERRTTWPAYDDLPESLRVNDHAITLRQGAFVSDDGRRAFLIGVYSRDDPRYDLYGRRELDELPPNHGLYDPYQHGWIYDRPLDAESASRLGFNLYCVTLTPTPFYQQVGYRARIPEDPDYVVVLARALRMPFYVDYVAWPWTLGAPGQRGANVLQPECLNPQRGHWMPYRTIGAGREVWLALWRLYAERLRDAGVPVLMYELFNEPGYGALTVDHRQEFVAWLQERYESLDAVNETWGSSWASWEEIRDHPSPRDEPALWLDYDEYLGDTFTQLFKAGRDTIREIDPNAVCVVQPKRRAALVPFDAVHYDKILRLHQVVVAPTDGGIWTSGDICEKPPHDWIDTPLAPAPISSDLLLEIASDRMLFDNELYLTGQTRRATRNDWWTRVLLGYDGATLFSWSKRGWSWWEGEERLREEARNHPYTTLLPLARRTVALRGILDFALEIEEVRDFVLPKPWGPRPRIAFLWSWGNARRKACDGGLPERAMAYYAALRYTHWLFAVLPSDYATVEELSKFRVVILPGTQFLERKAVRNLEIYVRNGGLLLVGEGTASQTPYGPPNGFSEMLGVSVCELESTQSRISRPQQVSAHGLPPELKLQEGVCRLQLSDAAKPLLLDSLQRPVVTEHRIGAGSVWYQAAVLDGYSLATVISWLLEMAGEQKQIGIYEAESGEYATNLLVSLREYGGHLAILLRNQNGYSKRLRIIISLPSGDWSVRDPLDQGHIALPSGRTVWSGKDLQRDGIPLEIEPRDFRLLLLERLRTG